MKSLALALVVAFPPLYGARPERLSGKIGCAAARPNVSGPLIIADCGSRMNAADWEF